MAPSRHRTVEDFLRQLVESGTGEFTMSAKSDADGNVSVSISTADGSDARDYRALGHTLQPL